MVRSRTGTTPEQAGRRLIVSGLLLILTSCFLPAQKLAYEYFAIREGISNRLVNDVIYDNNGLVWVGTANGLNRFDGYEFVSFHNSENTADLYRISQNQIKELNLAPNGDLIIFYEDLYTSFDLFDPVTFEVQKVEVLMDLNGDARPRALFVDWMGDVYAIGKDKDFTSLFRYDYEQDQFDEVFAAEEIWHTQYPTINALHLFLGRFPLL